MMNSYEVKLKQFTNKFINPTEELLEKTREYFRDDKQYATTRECYEAFLERLNRDTLLKSYSPPSWTSWKYVVYYKEESFLSFIEKTIATRAGYTEYFK